MIEKSRALTAPRDSGFHAAGKSGPSTTSAVLDASPAAGVPR